MLKAAAARWCQKLKRRERKNDKVLPLSSTFSSKTETNIKKLELKKNLMNGSDVSEASEAILQLDVSTNKKLRPSEASGQLVQTDSAQI